MAQDTVLTAGAVSPAVVVQGSRVEMFTVQIIAILKMFNICLPLLQALGVGVVNHVLPHTTQIKARTFFFFLSKKRQTFYKKLRALKQCGLFIFLFNLRNCFDLRYNLAANATKKQAPSYCCQQSSRALVLSSGKRCHITSDHCKVTSLIF